MELAHWHACKIPVVPNCEPVVKLLHATRFFFVSAIRSLLVADIHNLVTADLGVLICQQLPCPKIRSLSFRLSVLILLYENTVLSRRVYRRL
jgi:hypothetical protein